MDTVCNLILEKLLDIEPNKKPRTTLKRSINYVRNNHLFPFVVTALEADSEFEWESLIFSIKAFKSSLDIRAATVYDLPFNLFGTFMLTRFIFFARVHAARIWTIGVLRLPS